MHAGTSCSLGNETYSERPPGSESFAKKVLGLQEATKKLVHAHDEEVTRLVAELESLRLQLQSSNACGSISCNHGVAKQGKTCNGSARRLPKPPQQHCSKLALTPGEDNSFRRPMMQKNRQPQVCDEEPPQLAFHDAEKSAPRRPRNIQIELETPIADIVHEDSATALTSCLRSAITSPVSAPLKPKALTAQRSNSSVATIQQGCKIGRSSSTLPSGEVSGSRSPASSENRNQLLLTGDLGYTLRQAWAIDRMSLQRKLFKVKASNSLARQSLERKNSFEWMQSRSGLGGWENAPLHPESRLRVLWDIMASLLLAYDLVTRPLDFFELPDAFVFQIMDWVVAIYWVLDIFASLSTGTYIQGELQLKLRHVILHYAQRWMIFDIMVCTSDFVLLAHGKSRSFATSLRILRLLRLLRLVKLEKLLSKLADRTNSIIHLLMLKISFNMSLIIIIIHVLGSLWYSIGIDGWVEAYPWPSTDFEDRYFVSIHWCLTQFHGGMEVHPTNVRERMFAVVVLLLALIIFSWFVGSLTEALMKLQMVHSERTMHMKEVCVFLEQHQVSVPLTVQLKQYFIRNRSVRLQRQKDVMLLQTLPVSLSMDLHEEIRGALLVTHPFFWKLCQDFPRLVRELCQQSIQERVVSPNDIVFSTGDACKCAYLLERGCMLYQRAAHLSWSGQLPMQENSRSAPSKKESDEGSMTPEVSLAHSGSTNSNRGVKERIEETVSRIVRKKSNEDETLGRGHWISEACLWTHWENCGELAALSEGFVQMLQAESFAQLISLYEKAHMEAALYASTFIMYLNRVFPSDLQEAEFINRTMESAELMRENLKSGADIDDASP